jgi:hypothetical protein
MFEKRSLPGPFFLRFAGPVLLAIFDDANTLSTSLDLELRLETRTGPSHTVKHRKIASLYHFRS